MLVSTFAKRLKEAIDKKNIKPAEIVRQSETLANKNLIAKPLTKPLLSNYLKGTYEAKQDNVSTLSIILNVDEAWLMGYDVPMEKKIKSNRISENFIDASTLTEEQRKEVTAFIEFLKSKGK